jgi:hypothetical protein
MHEPAPHQALQRLHFLCGRIFEYRHREPTLQKFQGS